MSKGSPNDSDINFETSMDNEITRLDAVIAKLKQDSQDYSLDDDPDYKKRHDIALSIEANETSKKTLQSCIATLRLQTVVPNLSVGDFVQPVSTKENDSLVNSVNGTNAIHANNNATTATTVSPKSVKNKRNATESGMAPCNEPKKFRRSDFADQTIHLRIQIFKMGRHPDMTKRLSVPEMIDKFNVCESAVYKYLNPDQRNERFACELELVHMFESIVSPDLGRRIEAVVLATGKKRKTIEGIVEKSAILALKDITAKLWEELHNPEPGWSVHMDSAFDTFVEPNAMVSFKDVLSKRWLVDYRKENPLVVK